MNNDLTWKMVYTRAKIEQKVVKALSNKNIEAICPRFAATNNQWGHEGIDIKPVFPSIVFVRTGKSELDEICKIKGVISIVYRLNAPAIISDDDIASMNNFALLYNNITIKQYNLDFGKNNKIATDSFTDDQNIACVSLPSIGYFLLSRKEDYRIRDFSASQLQNSEAGESYPVIEYAPAQVVMELAFPKSG